MKSFYFFKIHLSILNKENKLPKANKKIYGLSVYLKKKLPLEKEPAENGEKIWKAIK